MFLAEKKYKCSVFLASSVFMSKAFVQIEGTCAPTKIPTKTNENGRAKIGIHQRHLQSVKKQEFCLDTKKRHKINAVVKCENSNATP